MPPLPATAPADLERPRLDLSGPRLTGALRALVSACEPQGGIELYVAAVKLKSTLFTQALHDTQPVQLDLERFRDLCALMASVRRRIGVWLNHRAFGTVKQAIVELLTDVRDTAHTDLRIDAFCGHFPRDNRHRWVRDLAAEILHNTDPQRYPLMCRWVWDARPNSGVLREIWHADDPDHSVIPVTDNYATFVMLREELSGFLTANGIFRDVPFYVDLLCAQIYAGYICAQGGAWLRSDFTTAEDPLVHTRRLLGLDGVNPASGRTRLKTAVAGATLPEHARLPDTP